MLTKEDGLVWVSISRLLKYSANLIFSLFSYFTSWKKKESTLSPAAVRQPRHTWKDKKKTPSSFPPVLRWKAE